MGVYRRPDSPVWWLYLETTRQKERTEFRIGTTTAQRQDSRRLAEDRYHQRMNEIAARLYQLPTATPAIRFDAFAQTYLDTVIPHHRGAEREREILAVLRAAFGDELLTSLDRERVGAWMTARVATVSARTVNREVDVLKAMLRTAVPKYLVASPLAGMRRLRVVPPKRRLLTPAEERKLLKAADRTERALILLALDGLVRLSDALDVQRVDVQGPWVYIRDPKGGHAYEVALTPRAEKALAAVPGREPYYFQRYRGAVTARDRRSRVRRALKTLCQRAKVPYGRALQGITFHWATRRTGATRLLVGRGVDVPTVQRQGNWKTPDVLLEIYAESNRAAQLKAVRFPTRSRSKRKSA